MIVFTSKRMSLYLVSSVAIAAGACGGGSGGAEGGGDMCTQAETKLQGCGLIPQGTQITCSPPPSDERCEMDCMQNVSCSDLIAEYCNSGGGWMSACWKGCRAGNFTCRNGLAVASSHRCDGANDCSDGSDETGCSMLTCKNGHKVRADYRCDGTDDCGDGSDETGCPTFTCRNGDTILAISQCDGRSDCADGSDEVNCSADLQSVIICP